ncbi:TetR/AcrR family transcriptional regulator [Nocardia stercoris]|uniref:TetR/AcrR family transcriptional regulator n=1 Tax=Nocardia stercoris TaxID=2483361 RepID=UPI00131A2044|nr:TetR/AcrR family transcriptional regulator [Nocardia stercoris]
MEQTRRRTPRGTLNKPMILAAAAAVIAEQGAEAMTMRLVATRLGVDPMALYRHFGNKADLLAASVEDAYEQVPMPEAGGIEGFQQLVRGLYRVFVIDRPGLLDPTLRVSTDRSLAIMDRMLAFLAEAGLPVRTAVALVGNVNRFLIGCAAMQRQPGDWEGSAEFWAQGKALLAADPARYPALWAAIGEAPVFSQEDVLESWFEVTLGSFR